MSTPLSLNNQKDIADRITIDIGQKINIIIKTEVKRIKNLSITFKLVKSSVNTRFGQQPALLPS